MLERKRGAGGREEEGSGGVPVHCQPNVAVRERARGGACANTLRVHASVCTWMPLSVSVGCLCQVRDCLLPNAQVACMRADVRACVQTKMAGEFKKLFAPYDWSLKDD